jgi:hypothetical protein
MCSQEVNKLEIVVGQLWYVSGNSVVNVAGVLVVFYIFVISEYCNREGGAEEEVLMVGKTSEHG